MKPRVLDLFCGEGGAGMGYCDAGFEVVGVDLNPQPRYPFAFLQMDATLLDRRFLATFDLVHASPPCQFGTAMRHAPGAKGEAGHPNLIPATRAMLRKAGVHYVIENVEAVKPYLVDPIHLCGSMFGLGCTTSQGGPGGAGQSFQLQRHRLFEANWPLRPPGHCDHVEPVVGVYGAHVRNRSRSHGGRGTADFVGEDRRALMVEVMQMPWATMAGMSEAIPPAYARHIGEAFIRSQVWRRAA